MPTSAAEALLATVAYSPDGYPQRLDLMRRCTLLLGFDFTAYRQASFLDDRVLSPDIVGGWVTHDRLDDATRHIGVARPLHLILHAGHVGSTLLSRLIDELGGTLPLREPLPLRTLADAHDDLQGSDSLLSPEEFGRLGELYLRLWSRGYVDTRQCVLKATSSACRFAPWLLERRPAMNAVYLNLAAEPYLATLLAGENSPTDLRGHSQERHRRLAVAGVPSLAPLHALSPGELAALSWLAESLTRHQLAKQFPGRTLLLDFDQMLADVPCTMHAVARHFGIAYADHQLTALASSPTLQRYSKAPEYAYGPTLRADILRQARQHHAAEIKAGLDWIALLARAHPKLADAAQAAGF